MKKFIIIAATLVAVAAGIYLFKNKDSNGINLNVNLGDNDVLAYVPEDTLFFSGSIEPISFEEAMKMSQMMGMDPSSFMMMDPEGLKIDEDAPEALKFLVGFYSKYLEAFSNDLPKDLGINSDLNAATYTIGALPVLRIELDGTDTFANLIASINKEHSLNPVVKNIGAMEYQEYSFDAKDKQLPYQLVVSIHENQAVVSVNTPLVDDKDVKLALGVEKPVTNILDSNKLSSLTSKHGLESHSLMFLDNVALVKGITHPQSNSFGKMLDELLVAHNMAGALNEYQTPACQTELTGLAANWPLIAAGYSEFSAKNANLKMVIEGNNDELLNTLSKLRGHLSSNLDNDQFAMSFGFGLNVDELVPVITDVWKRLTKEPFNCAPLAQMQASLKQQNPMMIGMMTGMFSGIKGIGFGIVDVDLEALQQSSDPMAATQNMDMLLTITAEEPISLLQKVGMYAPELAQLDLKDGGEAQTLPSPMGNDMKIALRGHDLVLMMGKNSANTLNGLTVNTSTASNGLISMNMDFGKYMSILEQAMSSLPTDDAANAQHSKTLEQQKAMIEKLKTIKGDIKQSFDITPSGFVSNTSFQSK